MHDSIITALDAAGSALEQLDRRCCDVGRSPRLAAIAATLGELRRATERPEGMRPEMVAALLEEVGAMVGALQVGCCAPDRLPLYATVLEQLNVVQRHVAPMH